MQAGAGAKDAAVGLEPTALPPFVQVERTLLLGLEWRVNTQIRRLSPKGVAVALAVPLLGGESVTTDGLNIEDAKVQIALGPDATVAGWESVLKPDSPIALISPDDTRWTETWLLEASPIWHVDAQGIPVIDDSS
jgi:hypothetical protein